MIQLRWMVSICSRLSCGAQHSLIRPTRSTGIRPFSPDRSGQWKYHFYVVKGEGKPVVLIHGYGAGCGWERQIEVLSQHYRVYALDLIAMVSQTGQSPLYAETYILFSGILWMGRDRSGGLNWNSMGGGIAGPWQFSFLKGSISWS